MAPRVLVSDELSETAVQIFRDRGVEVPLIPPVRDTLPRNSDRLGGPDRREDPAPEGEP